ncbi:MAG: DUF4249 domain-containing protein [Chryseosolibacter sp.]
MINRSRISSGYVTALVLTGVAWLMTSCFPDPLEVQTIPEAKVEMVVSTLMIPDQTLMVLLTRTFGALDASDDSDPQELLDFIAVNDAVVTVEGPESRDTLVFTGNGVYTGGSIAFKAGETYRLFVRSEEYGELYAATEVKPRVEFTKAEAGLYYNGYNDTLAQITYAFKDPPEKNWYMVNVQEVEQEDFIENLLNPRAFTILINDEGFNDQTFGERFRVFPRDYGPGDTIALSLSNISEEYYRFMKLRIDNRFSFVEFISEPLNYPSNVVGGKGYFNLYVPDVEIFVFE